MTLVSRRLYEILGLACGFVLIDYGFSFIAAGFPGARALTSQFIGANLLIAGSAVVFLALFYLLKSATATPAVAQPATGAPDVGVETVVEEQTPPKAGFYKNVEYVGYFFTFLGLFSAADLVLQVLIPPLYNEARWWVEILLVVFGVLSYTIFGSVGRLGSQEEAELAKMGAVPSQPALTLHEGTSPAEAPKSAPSYPEVLDVRLNEFAKSASGEYEHHLAAEVYDRVHIERDLVTIWREDRQGMRSVYLAGPYELNRKLLEDYLSRGEQLRIGILSLSTDAMRELAKLQGYPAQTSVAND